MLFRSIVLGLVLLGLVVSSVTVARGDAVALDREPARSGELEVDYAPHDGEVSATNPPAFIWLPHAGVASWLMQYSTDAAFEAANTVSVTGRDMTVFVPTETLAPGDWHWRYGYEHDGVAVWSRTRSFTVPEDATLFPFPDMADVLARIPETRPRAYFSPADVAAIRANADGAYDWLIGPVVRAAERVLEEDAPLFEEPKPWEAYGDEWANVYNDNWRRMRPYTRGMEICARAYLFTGDARFAEEAKRRLLHFMTWDVDGPSSVYWPTELGMDIAEHAPRSFDWIYDTLDEEERAMCLEVLGKRIRQVNEMHRGRPFEARPFSSHPGRMIGFAVEGSLILAHAIEDAADWLEYTLQVLWSVYPAWGGHEGGWHEGISYWGSYMRRMTQVVAELDRLGIPLKDKPFFRNTGDFGLYAAYPNRPTRAFGDGYEYGVGASYGHLMHVFASLYDDPYYMWYAEQLETVPSGPGALTVWNPALTGRAPVGLPQSKAFFDVGWVAMHSDMAAPDENILFLMQASPYGAISHNHANQNAFVVEAYGEALAISSGYYQTYADPHHREWVWHTKAHNCILVNGEGQDIRSAASRGHLVAHAEHGDWAYALGDATEAYGGRLEKALRHVVFIRPNIIVIVDDLATAGDPATFQWLLHAKREMALDEDAQRVTLAQGDAEMRVQFLAPMGLSFDQATGWEPPAERPDAAPPQFHFTASTTETAVEMRIVTVLMPYRSGERDALPERVALVEADDAVIVQIDDRHLHLGLHGERSVSLVEVTDRDRE